jgi:ABC-2 type transport system permease protein
MSSIPAEQNGTHVRRFPEGRIQKATGFTLFWRTMLARAYPRVIGSMRERSWLFFETILPLMSTASFVFVYRALEAPSEYVGFVVLGGAMTAFWLNVLWSMGSQLYWDKNGGNLELYVICPGPMMAILLGMAVGGLVMSGTRALIIVVICTFLFGVTFSLAQAPLLILVFLLTMGALYGMGMMFASIFLAAGREAWHISNLLQEPIYLVSGFYFPVKAMGFWVAAAASIIPLTLGMDAMRQLLFPSGENTGFLSIGVEIGILFVLTVFFVGAAKFMLDKLEEIGRRDGRLIERRR